MFANQLKSETTAVIEVLKKANIRTIMVTGGWVGCEGVLEKTGSKGEVVYRGGKGIMGFRRI